jgi:spermidine synthase
MIRLAKEHPVFLKYNYRGLHSSKVHVHEQDAFTWVGTNHEKYDLIIIDFPAPKNLTLARLFSLEFYNKVKKLLKDTGFISIQAGPSYSFSDPNGDTLSEVTASIEKTLVTIGFSAQAYVASKDSEAFVLAWKNPAFEMEAFAKKLGMYNDNGVGSLCMYKKSWKRPVGVSINTLNTLPISRYMLEWFREYQGSFFVYRGTHSVFLPD